MLTNSSNDKIFIGREAGIKILEAIKNAKTSVKIVSPYLSASYLEELVKLRKKGADVTLITSDKLEDDKRGYSPFRLSDIIKQEKIIDVDVKNKKEKGIKISWLLLLLSFFTFVLSFLVWSLFYLSALVLIIGLATLVYFSSVVICSYQYNLLFRIKVFDSKSGKNPQSTNLIHSKIFVIDDKIAFLGSANFTYSGFTIHYETVIKVEDLKAVRDISQEVETLYHSTELRSKPVEEWAQINKANKSVFFD